MLLGVPFRAFTTATRGVLEGLNAVANRLLRIWHVEPVEEAVDRAGSGRAAPAHRRVPGARPPRSRVGAPAHPGARASGTPVYAVTLPWADVDRGAAGRHRRRRGPRRLPRWALPTRRRGWRRTARRAGARARRPARRPAAPRWRDLVYETVRLDVHATVVDALGRMRAERAQLALVVEPGDDRRHRHRDHRPGGPDRAGARGVRGRDRPPPSRDGAEPAPPVLSRAAPPGRRASTRPRPSTGPLPGRTTSARAGAVPGAVPEPLVGAESRRGGQRHRRGVGAAVHEHQGRALAELGAVEVHRQGAHRRVGPQVGRHRLAGRVVPRDVGRPVVADRPAGREGALAQHRQGGPQPHEEPGRSRAGPPATGPGPSRTRTARCPGRTRCCCPAACARSRRPR